MDRSETAEERGGNASRISHGRALDLPDFEFVYTAHRSHVDRYCLARLADPAAAKDATASAFTKASAPYRRVRPDSEWVRLWLLHVAANVIRDERSSRWRRGRLFAALVASRPPGSNPEDRAHLTLEAQP